MDGMLELLRLINTLGEVKGRKKLQKIVHILQSQGHDFPQHFGYLHYGPYSSALAAEVDSLVRDKLLAEEGRGGEYEAFVYRPNQRSQELLGELNAKGTPKWKSLAEKLNANDANYLEALSTILYLRTNGFDGAALKARFMSLKPALKNFFDQAHQDAASLSKA